MNPKTPRTPQQPEHVTQLYEIALKLREYAEHSSYCRYKHRNDAMSSLCDCGLRELAIEFDKYGLRFRTGGGE